MRRLIAWPVMAVILGLTGISGARSTAAEPARQTVSLNGAWQCRVVTSLDQLPDDGGRWKTVQVPGYLDGYDYRRAWFRRSFAVPKTMRGQRVVIRFGGVKYNSRIHVNGHNVGGCFGGYQPFEVDVTDAVRFDAPNRLLVGCYDWTGVFTPGKTDFGDVRGSNQLRGVPRDKVLAPVGGLFSRYGIWDDVTLQARPGIYIADLFIKPSVRHGELVVDYTLANESSAVATTQLTGAVEDEGRDVLSLPARTVQIPARGRIKVSVRQPWSNVHLWSHVDPYLYHLRTELSAGDRLRTRFGFREFWTEGNRFYLNGTPITLLATAGWPPRDRPMSRDEIRHRWQAIKRAGCVAFRTHTQPWRSVHYDVADEVGILIVVEGAVFNDDMTYRINDPVFWNNYEKHLRAMVANHKNHPAIVMWSLENEFFGSRLNDESPAKKDLIRMGRVVKQCDPTRPITYESDGDPGGVADVIGIHYPHEYPFFTCWPNEANWLSKPQPSDRLFLNGADEFFWKKDKPLYVGESLWIPSNDPSWNTVFEGDDAYIQYQLYRTRAKATAWRMQVLGYRHFDVGGMCPWTMMEGSSLDESSELYAAVKYAYQPIAAYCHDYDSRFYSDDQVMRRVEVFNNVLTHSDLMLNWTLTQGDKVVDKGTERVSPDPNEHRMLSIDLRMPACANRTNLQWRIRLTRSGETVFSDKHDYVLFPRPARLDIKARFGLFDPQNTTRQLLDQIGVTTEEVGALEQIPNGLDVLVIGAHAFGAEGVRQQAIGYVDPRRAAIQAFVSAGGRVLVLEQDHYPAGLFAADLSDHQSTMTFAAATTHPALRGIEPEDLKFWRQDHLVTMPEPIRPEAGASAAIVVSGSVAGLDHAPLLERRWGAGCIIHAQLRLVTKYRVEPAAARILDNLLHYLADRQPRRGKTGLVGGTAEYRNYLHSLGLDFDDLTGRLAQLDLSPYSLLLVRSSITELDLLREFVERGGNLLVHRSNASDFNKLRSGLDAGLHLVPYHGTVTRREPTDGLTESIVREDVYWLGEPVGHARTTPRAVEMADGIFSQVLQPQEITGATVHEVEEWTLAGHIVQRRAPGVTFATTGTATAQIDFASSGRWTLAFVASGTPCDGAYPLCQVTVDDQPFGKIAISSDQWESCAVSGQVERGRHKITLAFLNDGSNATEDRNLFVDKMLMARTTAAATALTDPPSTVCFQRGKGLVVLDQLRWDTQERSTRKAARYAASLLTALGGTFNPRLGVIVQCELMTPQPKRNQIQRRSGYMSLASEGWIASEIQVAKSGRYTMELVASGSQANDIYPLIEARVDGRRVGQFQLTVGGWRSYPIDLELAAGSHRLQLEFMNDLYVPGVGDRNVLLDKAVFYLK